MRKLNTDHLPTVISAKTASCCGSLLTCFVTGGSLYPEQLEYAMPNKREIERLLGSRIGLLEEVAPPLKRMVQLIGKVATPVFSTHAPCRE